MNIYYDGPSYGIADRQQVRPAGVCHECQGEFYSGEQVFLMDGKALCKECFKEKLLDLLDTSPDVLALLVGAQTETV